MDSVRLVRPLPDFVIPGLVSVSLLTGIGGAISLFDGLSALGSGRSQAVASQQLVEQKLSDHADRRKELNSYQENGLNLIETGLYMSNYWCSSGEKPWDPVTNSMVFEDTQPVYDMGGVLAGRILIDGTFQINQDCWREEDARKS